MTQWVRKGISSGVKTTRYPDAADTTPGLSPGLPLGGGYPAAEISSLVDRCPTKAISARDAGGVAVDYRRCIHCFRCARGPGAPLAWTPGYEWGARGGEVSPDPLGAAFERSLYILVVDAGDCGACLSEVRQLNNPYYNMHRLGFFITPTPRLADVLLVVGPVTDHMRRPLQKTYEAMPTPKRVMAVGACALSGGVFGPSFVSGAGVAEVLSVDVAVPGSPPPPLAILHGLLVLAGRRPPASLLSPAQTAGTDGGGR